MARTRKRSTVGAYEAKTNLPRLLEEAAAGLTITITKHGRPVARLVPPVANERPEPDQVVASLRQARQGIRLKGLSLRELIEEGRR
jgi:prevent-host-death family protein